MISPTDAELVRSSQHGDRDAWSILVRRHAPRLAAYLGSRLRRPTVIERLVEEAIVGAWKHLGELANPADFPGWFRRIGANLALRWYRHHQDAGLTEPFPADRCGDDPQVRERMTKLEVAMGTLADPARMALELSYRGGLSGWELAEALHVGPAQVERTVDEALTALQHGLAAPSP